MKANKQKPEAYYGEGFKGRDVVTHPSFGLVRVGRISCGGETLFDSEIDHREVIELTFHTAAIERDGLDKKVIKGEDRKTLLVARFSPAQWAGLVSSFGVGEGVPCTLSKIRDGNVVHLPAIEKEETIVDKFDDEIVARAKAGVAHIDSLVGKLGLMLASGKIGKKELRDIHNSLSSAVGNLPANIAFSTDLAQEAMDSIVASGKAEIEAYVAGTAMRLGIEQIISGGAVDGAEMLVNLISKEDGENER